MSVVAKASILSRARRWLHASRLRQWAAGALGLVMLLAGAALLFMALRPLRPPDILHAADEQIIEFLAGDYVKLKSGERDRFLRGVADRVMAMSREQRIAFDQRWRAVPQKAGIRGQIDAQVNMALVRRMAEQYDQMPDQARGPFLDHILAMIDVFGPDSKESLSWLNSQSAHGFLTWLGSENPSVFIYDLDPFQRQLVFGTSAEERARLVRLGGDLLEHARRRKR